MNLISYFELENFLIIRWIVIFNKFWFINILFIN